MPATSITPHVSSLPRTQLGLITARGPGPQPSLYLYHDSEGRVMLRGWSNTTHHPTQRCVVAFRVVMWLCWGPPPTPKSDLEVPRTLACHVACDHHRCLNPTHGRWGTVHQNMHEWRLLREYRRLVLSLPAGHAHRAAHPCHDLLANQGFACYTPITHTPPP